MVGDFVTLVMYHGGDFLRNEYHKLEYVRRNCVRNENEVELYFQHSIVEDPKFLEMIEEEITMLDKVIESQCW
jgi:hypothetical protein